KVRPWRDSRCCFLRGVSCRWVFRTVAPSRQPIKRNLLRQRSIRKRRPRKRHRERDGGAWPLTKRRCKRKNRPPPKARPGRRKHGRRRRRSRQVSEKPSPCGGKRRLQTDKHLRRHRRPPRPKRKGRKRRQGERRAQGGK